MQKGLLVLRGPRFNSLHPLLKKTVVEGSFKPGRRQPKKTRVPQLSSEEKAYLDKLLAEKGKRLGLNFYRGTLDGFHVYDFHDKCYGVAPTVSLIKVKENQNWISGYTTVGWKYNLRMVLIDKRQGNHDWHIDK